MELIEQMTRPHLLFMLAKYVPHNRYKALVNWKTEHLQGLLKFYLTPERKEDMIGEYEYPIGFKPGTPGSSGYGRGGRTGGYTPGKPHEGRSSNTIVIEIEVGEESHAIVENLKHLLKL